MINPIRILSFLLFLVIFNSSLAALDSPKIEDDAVHDKSSELDTSIPFEPINIRDKKTEMKVEAAGYFMAAGIKKSRNDFLGALSDYEKAAEIDPNSLEIYAELVPLAFALNRIDQAVKYALKAIELDPNNHMLMQRLGIYMIKKQKYADAISLFEKALLSEELPKNSVSYLSLKRDLAVLYAATGSIEKSSEAYEVVFNALQGTGEIKLDYQTKSRLLSDPQTSYERMGQIFLAAKKSDLAIKAFEEAAKSSKGKPGEKIINLANIYYETGKNEEALKELEKYIEKKLKSKERFAYELLEKILQKLNKENELVSRLEKALEEDPANYDLAYFLSDQYIKQNQLEKARELVEKTLKSSSKSEGHISLASINRLENKPWELIDDMAKAFAGGRQLERLEDELKLIQENEELSQAVLSAGLEKINSDEKALTFEHGLLLAKMAVSLKKNEDVETFYRHCLKVKRKNANAIYNELGQYYLDEKLYEKAVVVFQEAIDDPVLSDGKAHFLFQMSQALEMQGKTEEAIAAIQQSKSLQPNSPIYPFQESWIYIHSKRWDQAIAALESTISNFADQDGVVRRCRMSLSNVYVQKGDIEKGEEILEEVLKEDPEDPGVNNDLGYLYADQGKNLERAKNMIKIALDSDPDNPAYLDSMGWVLYRLEQYQEASEFLKKATEQPTGGDSTILDHLGDCYQKLDKKEEAVQTWNKALDYANKQAQPDQELIGKIEKKIQEINQ